MVTFIEPLPLLQNGPAHTSTLTNTNKRPVNYNSRNLKLTIHHPAATGPIPLAQGHSIVTLVNEAYGEHTKKGNPFFSGRRIEGGIFQLEDELGPRGWLMSWSTGDDQSHDSRGLQGEEANQVVATATLKLLGRGWRRLPTWDELHVHNIFQQGIPHATATLTEEGEKHIGAILKAHASMTLWEVCLVAVSPMLKRQGVGSFILSEAERLAHELTKEFQAGRRLLSANGVPDSKKDDASLVVLYTIRGLGIEEWYGKRGYKTISVAHKPKGFWGCRLEEGFDVVAMIHKV